MAIHGKHYDTAGFVKEYFMDNDCTTHAVRRIDGHLLFRGSHEACLRELSNQPEGYAYIQNDYRQVGVTAYPWSMRNQCWATPLVGGLIFIMTLAVLQLYFPINIPFWVYVTALVTGCIGLFVALLRSRLAGTPFEKVFCYFLVLSGYLIALPLFLKML